VVLWFIIVRIADRESLFKAARHVEPRNTDKALGGRPFSRSCSRRCPVRASAAQRSECFGAAVQTFLPVPQRQVLLFFVSPRVWRRTARIVLPLVGSGDGRRPCNRSCPRCAILGPCTAPFLLLAAVSQYRCP